MRHTIFGEVADQASRDVVDAIARPPLPTATTRPVDPVVIAGVEIQSSLSVESGAEAEANNHQPRTDDRERPRGAERPHHSALLPTP